jgi:hypothetical protein
MSPARAVAVVILVASVGANAVLARALSRGAKPQAVAEAPAAAAVEEEAPGSPGAGAAALGRCARQIDGLEGDIAGKSEALRAVLPAQVVFERGQPNPQAERLMAPILADALAPLEFAQHGHALACRDVACKVTFAAPATADDEAWDDALAKHKAFGQWCRQFALGDATPTEDGMTRQPLVQRTVYLKLDGPRALAAARTPEPASGGR